jgi:hypothetical protein
MIPNFIWQTHEAEYDDLEPFQLKVTNTWRNLNPGWNYMYVSKTARGIYLEEFNDFLINCYTDLSGINQADLFKMLIVHKFGGFYADMDSVCTMPLDEVVANLTDDKELVCSSVGWQTTENNINCSNFGGIPNGQNLTKIIEKSVIDYKEILDKKEVELKNLVPGQPTWTAFSDTNVNNQDTILFHNDYFMHSENFKVEFQEDYPVHHNNETITYTEFLELKNLTM